MLHENPQTAFTSIHYLKIYIFPWCFRHK